MFVRFLDPSRTRRLAILESSAEQQQKYHQQRLYCANRWHSTATTCTQCKLSTHSLWQRST